MTFLAFRPFRRRKHRNDVIVTSYIKILQILKLKSKDITSKTLHAKFHASRIKNKQIRRGGKIRPPRVWSVFKSPGKIGLMFWALLKNDFILEISPSLIQVQNAFSLSFFFFLKQQKFAIIDDNCNNLTVLLFWLFLGFTRWGETASYMRVGDEV